MRIEAVTVCINYSHVFKKCVGNARFIDRWIVVTHASDKDTISLCESNDIEYILSDRIYDDNAPFAKGRAINEGLDRLTKTDWLLHIDSDVKLPRNFNRVLKDSAMDINCLYGSCRYHEDGLVNIELDNNGEPYDTVASDMVLGFFQLWHSSKFEDYPENSENAKWDDMDHSRRFAKRVFLPLFLTDMDNEHNKNHYGRINN